MDIYRCCSTRDPLFNLRNFGAEYAGACGRSFSPYPFSNYATAKSQILGERGNGRGKGDELFPRIFPRRPCPSSGNSITRSPTPTPLLSLHRATMYFGLQNSNKFIFLLKFVCSAYNFQSVSFHLCIFFFARLFLPAHFD